MRPIFSLSASPSDYLERRMVRFAEGGMKFDVGMFDKDLKEKIAGETIDKNTPLPLPETPEERAKTLVSTVNTKVEQHQEALKGLPDPVHKALQEGMVNFIATTATNTDKNGKKGLEESEFAAFQKSITDTIDAQLGKLADRRQEVKSQVEDAVKKQEREQEEAKKKAMKFEDLLAKIKSETLNKPTIKESQPGELEPTDPEKMKQRVEAQLTEYQQDIAEIQTLQKSISGRIGDIQLLHDKGKENLKTLSDAVNAGGAAVAAAAGAALGAPLFGVGALAGAAIGLLAYGITRGAINEAQRQKNEQKAQEMNTNIKEAKDTVQTASKNATDAQEKTAKNGNALNTKTEPLQTSIVTTIENKRVSLETEQQNRVKLDGTKQQLEDQLKAMRFMREEALKKDKNANLGSVNDSITLSQGRLDQVIAVSGATDGNILKLQQEFEASRGQLTNLQDADQLIANNVVDSQVNLTIASMDIEAGKEQLAKLPSLKESVQGFMAGLGSGFEGVGFAFSKGISPVLDDVSKFLKENIPLAGKALAFPVDFASGLAAGGGELIGGIGMILSNPAEMAEGIAKLFTDGEARSQMLAALTAQEEFEKGNIGKGLGKVSALILTTATGAGGAGALARGSSVTFKAMRASGSNVASATVKAGFAGARVGTMEFLNGAAQIPGNVLSLAGKVIKTPVSLVRRLRTENAVRLGADVEMKAARLAEVEAELGKLKLPAEVVNMSDEALAALMKNGDDLVKYQIKDVKTVSQLLEARKLIKERSSLVRAAQNAELAILELDNLKPAMKDKTGGGLVEVMQEFNLKGLKPERAYQIVEAGPDGSLIAFNAKGELVLLTPAEISPFLKEASVYAEKVGKEAGNLNKKGVVKKPLQILTYADEARLIVTRELMKDFEIQLTPAQEAAILRAHRLPNKDLLAKDRILGEAGIPKKVRRKLMEEGITGETYALVPEAGAKATTGAMTFVDDVGKESVITENSETYAFADDVVSLDGSAGAASDTGKLGPKTSKVPKKPDVYAFADESKAGKSGFGNVDFAGNLNLPEIGAKGILKINGKRVKVEYSGKNKAGNHIFDEIDANGLYVKTHEYAPKKTAAVDLPAASKALTPPNAPKAGPKAPRAEPMKGPRYIGDLDTAGLDSFPLKTSSGDVVQAYRLGLEGTESTLIYKDPVTKKLNIVKKTIGDNVRQTLAYADKSVELKPGDIVQIGKNKAKNGRTTYLIAEEGGNFKFITEPEKLPKAARAAKEKLQKKYDDFKGTYNELKKREVPGGKKLEEFVKKGPEGNPLYDMRKGLDDLIAKTQEEIVQTGIVDGEAAARIKALEALRADVNACLAKGKSYWKTADVVGKNAAKAAAKEASGPNLVMRSGKALVDGFKDRVINRTQRKIRLAEEELATAKTKLPENMTYQQAAGDILARSKVAKARKASLAPNDVAGMAGINVELDIIADQQAALSRCITLENDLTKLRPAPKTGPTEAKAASPLDPAETALFGEAGAPAKAGPVRRAYDALFNRKGVNARNTAAAKLETAKAEVSAACDAYFESQFSSEGFRMNFHENGIGTAQLWDECLNLGKNRGSWLTAKETRQFMASKGVDIKLFDEFLYKTAAKDADKFSKISFEAEQVLSGKHPRLKKETVDAYIKNEADYIGYPTKISYEQYLQTKSVIMKSIQAEDFPLITHIQKPFYYVSENDALAKFLAAKKQLVEQLSKVS